MALVLILTVMALVLGFMVYLDRPTKLTKKQQKEVNLLFARINEVNHEKALKYYKKVLK